MRKIVAYKSYFREFMKNFLMQSEVKSCVRSCCLRQKTKFLDITSVMCVMGYMNFV